MLSPLEAMQSMGILIISSALLASDMNSRRQLLERLLGDRFPVYHQILLLGYSRLELELPISTLLFLVSMISRDRAPSIKQ